VESGSSREVGGQEFGGSIAPRASRRIIMSSFGPRNTRANPKASSFAQNRNTAIMNCSESSTRVLGNEQLHVVLRMMNRVDTDMVSRGIRPLAPRKRWECREGLKRGLHSQVWRGTNSPHSTVVAYREATAMGSECQTKSDGFCDRPTTNNFRRLLLQHNWIPDRLD
jgi:hypothetical protein